MGSSKTTKVFSDRLEDLILGSKKSIKELSNDIGISTGALSKYKNDDAEIGVNALKKIADYFGVSTDYLLGGAECKVPSNQKIADLLGLPEDCIEIFIILRHLQDNPGESIDKYFIDVLIVLLRDYVNSPPDDEIALPPGLEAFKGFNDSPKLCALGAITNYLITEAKGYSYLATRFNGRIAQNKIPHKRYVDMYLLDQVSDNLKRLKSAKIPSRLNIDEEINSHGEHQED